MKVSEFLTSWLRKLWARWFCYYRAGIFCTATAKITCDGSISMGECSDCYGNLGCPLRGDK